MKIVPVVDAKIHLSSYLEACRTESVLVTKNGRPKALLVAVPEGDGEELERLLLAYNPRFWRILEQAAARVRSKGGIAHGRFWSLVGKGAGRRRPPRSSRRTS